MRDLQEPGGSGGQTSRRWWNRSAVPFYVTFVATWFVIMALLSSRGLVESNFELATDSRFPRWFVLPATVQRSDVTVEMAFMTSFGRGYARLVVRDKAGNELLRMNGSYAGPDDDNVQFNGVTERLTFNSPRPGFFRIREQP